MNNKDFPNILIQTEMIHLSLPDREYSSDWGTILHMFLEQETTKHSFTTN